MPVDESKAVDPVAVLRELEESCRACSAELPGKTQTANEWSGIAFRLGGNNLVTALGEVVEILDVPALTVVPLSQPWVRGLANLRGTLLPVIDLGGYLGGSVAQLTGRSRVLVIDYNGVYSGLVVDEVLGLRYFREDEFTEDDSGVDAFLQPYCRHGYRRGEESWVIFSMSALADCPQFLQAAV